MKELGEKIIMMNSNELVFNIVVQGFATYYLIPCKLSAFKCSAIAYIQRPLIFVEMLYNICNEAFLKKKVVMAATGKTMGFIHFLTLSSLIPLYMAVVEIYCASYEFVSNSISGTSNFPCNTSYRVPILPTSLNDYAFLER